VVEQSRHRRAGARGLGVGAVSLLVVLFRRSGGGRLESARPTFRGGFVGCFHDPDVHLWEVVFNPHLQTLG
jgi:hypothetical protein